MYNVTTFFQEKPELMKGQMNELKEWKNSTVLQYRL